MTSGKIKIARRNIKRILSKRKRTLRKNMANIEKREH